MKAVLWMLGTLASFSIMAIGAREVSGTIDTFQLLFYRNLSGLIIVLLISIPSGGIRSFRTQHIRQHLMRNTFHFAGQYGWFLGIALLPLAEVFALEFTTPVWTALIALFFLKERMNRTKVTAVALGLLGVLIIVKPGFAIFNTSSIIVLAAAVAFAIAHIYTKSLSSRESPMTILFYMNLIQLPLGLVLSLYGWKWSLDGSWLWIMIIAITGLTAHFCTAKAMQYAEVTTVVTLDFLRLPLIALVGVILYMEQFDVALLVGGFFTLIGNLLNVRKSLKQDTAL